MVLVKEVSCRAYDDARRQPGLPECYRETTAMQRFPLDRVLSELRRTRGQFRALPNPNPNPSFDPNPFPFLILKAQPRSSQTAAARLRPCSADLWAGVSP